MPRCHSNPPDEWPVISSYIDEVEQKMREIESSRDVGVREQERYWPIFRLHRERTRKIYDMYKSGAISKDLYRYCTENFFCDHVLVCYWKKNGYENLCCLRCIQNDSRHGNVCICRVPRRNFEADSVVECDSCGCRGCSGH